MRPLFFFFTSISSKFLVESEAIMQLRHMLDKLGSAKGLKFDQKDPEEILRTIFQDALKIEELYMMENGLGDYIIQVLGEPDKNYIPTTQKLLNNTFHHNGTKLTEGPECLIVQLPRADKDRRLYDRVFPSPVLQMDEIMRGTSRECIFCGSKAAQECKDCAGTFSVDDCVVPAFCATCYGIRHRVPQRMIHKPVALPDNDESPEEYELFGVLCIERSHYVAFTKTAKKDDAPWIFFDSMAYREEDHSGLGYNIPEVKYCRSLNKYLCKDRLVDLRTANLQGEILRFFSHPAIFFYRRIKKTL